MHLIFGVFLLVLGIRVEVNKMVTGTSIDYACFNLFVVMDM